MESLVNTKYLRKKLYPFCLPKDWDYFPTHSMRPALPLILNHTKELQENWESAISHEHGSKVLNKILKYVKINYIHNKMGFIPGIKAGSIVKNQLVYHINRLKKNHTSIQQGTEKHLTKSSIHSR